MHPSYVSLLMIRTLSTLLILFWSFLSGAFAQPEFSPARSWELGQTWQSHQDYDGRFTVMVPAAFRQKTDTIATAVGPLVYHTYFLQAPVDTAENELYMLSYVDYPAGTLHHDSTELLQEFFAATIETARKTVRGEIRFDTDVTIRGYPGRYWRIDYLNDRAGIRTKAFVVDNRYYTIQTISRRESGINRSTDRYFDSFRIFTPEEPIEAPPRNMGRNRSDGG